MPASMTELEAIYKIVSGLSAEFSKVVGKSCIFYNVLGANILREFYGVDARPVIGAAFF